MEVLEVLIVGIVLVFQLYFFRETFLEIKKLKHVFNVLNDIKIEVVVLSRKQLSSNIGEIINNFYADKLDFSELENTYHFNLIKIDPKSNATIKKIVTSINKYILKDKSKVVDFNIIKDVVERNCENIDGEINNQLPIPIYIGLTGTMFGIVLGLFGFNVTDFFQNINNASSGLIPVNSIVILFGGVKVAMIGSLLGLFFTIINTGVFYKTARRIVENDKNDFYTFIQTELLPTISQSVSSSIIELNHGLNRFTEKFDKNINQLESVVNNNLFAIKSQNTLLDKINELKPLKLTQSNLELFNRLDNNLLEFDKFHDFISGINNTLQATLKLNDRFDDLLSKTDSLSNLVEAFSTNTENAIGIQTFLQSNLKVITDREAALNQMTTKIDILLQESIKGINAHTENTLKGFNESIQISLQAITNQAVKQAENLKDSITIEENSFIQIFTQHQQKLIELSSESNYFKKLEKLDDIDQKLIGLDQTEQIDKIVLYTEQQNKNFEKYSSTIKEIKEILNKQSSFINGKKNSYGKMTCNDDEKSVNPNGTNPIDIPTKRSFKEFISKFNPFHTKSKETNV